MFRLMFLRVGISYYLYLYIYQVCPLRSLRSVGSAKQKRPLQFLVVVFLFAHSAYSPLLALSLHKRSLLLDYVVQNIHLLKLLAKIEQKS